MEYFPWLLLPTHIPWSLWLYGNTSHSSNETFSVSTNYNFFLLLNGIPDSSHMMCSSSLRVLNDLSTPRSFRSWKKMDYSICSNSTLLSWPSTAQSVIDRSNIGPKNTISCSELGIIWSWSYGNFSLMYLVQSFWSLM